MPELPEVEAVKRVLEPQIQGTYIEDLKISRPEVIAHPGAKEFLLQVKGQTLEGMERRGKYLILWLGNGSHIVIHLRMTGCLLLTPSDYPEEKHTHVIFRLRGDRELRFLDTRRFGRLWLIGKDEKDTCSGIGKLGKEPFDPDFNAAYLKQHLGKRKKAVKECLLEQKVIAGIGNIYSDEILFEANIYPARAAGSLTEEEWKRLAAVIPERLRYFIEKNETTAEEYLKTRGQEYRNTPFLKVYGQEGKPCPVCGTSLCRTVIGGRSSTYCPNCQKDGFK